MQLSIRGRSRVLSRPEIQLIFDWAGDQLLGRVSPYVNVFLTISQKRDLENKSMEGYCSWIGENHRPRDFEVWLYAGSKRKSSQIQTLFHEIVHIKQWARGKMKNYIREQSLARWGSKFIDMEKTPYHLYPWEIEAAKLEKSLYRKYLNFLKTEGISFDK